MIDTIVEMFSYPFMVRVKQRSAAVNSSICLCTTARQSNLYWQTVMRIKMLTALGFRLMSVKKIAIWAVL